MTRKLIALLLCIAMIGSMTVYAVGDEIEPTVPESSAAASEPTVPESSAPASEPTVPESSAPASEPTVPESSAPASEPTVPESSAPASEPTVPESSAPASEPTVPESSAPASEPTVPVVVDEPESAVGKTMWIKAGSTVYKNIGDTNGKECVWPHAITIKEELTDDTGAKWFKFSYNDIAGAIVLFGYNYIKVEDTSVTDPDTTEPSEPDDGFNIEYEEFGGTSKSGISAEISAPKGAFPEGTKVTVKDTTVDSSRVKSVVSGAIKGIVAVDISFGGQQPSERVRVSLDIPESKIPEDANMVQVVHMAEGGPDVCATYYLDSVPGEKIAFATNGFSTYVAVFVNGKYSSQKMSKVLEGNSRYSISTFNVDLFDYDPVTINNALNSVTDDSNGFHFTGYGITGMGSNGGINNSEADRAKQGILQSTLNNGLPVVNYLKGTNAGIDTGKVLFSDSEHTDKKTVYNDIPFELIYDNQTGFYEYKSSANHAQLNNAGTKIELYADTLSTQNAYVWSADLSSPISSNDFTGASATTSSYKATAKNSDTTSRLDPYVQFAVSDIDASTVGQIYVRAKIPASVGANGFQVFFTTAYGADGTTPSGWSEEQSFGNSEKNISIPYTANGDWIEFVIDTSDNPTYWTGTITGIRIDPFDANKGSVNGTGSYEIVIDQIRFIKKNYNEYATRGGFYPFSEIQDSYPGNNTYFNYGRWETLILNSKLAQDRASRAIYNPSPNPATDLYNELAYGMVMEFDFYLPVDRTGDDLTYYFNGDDDLWVFVDNKLALDIGGGHGAITGNLNFTNGSMEVESAVTVTGYDAGAASTPAKVTGTMDSDLWTAGKHTMKIFYLERGGSVSNCFMKFNLPRTPQGSVVVSKETVETNGASMDVLAEESFEYTIELQNNGAGVDYKTKAPLVNTDFYIVNADGSTVAGKTDSNGKFSLKHGQEAMFEIAENYYVTVTETMKDVPGYDSVSTTVNGTEAFTLTQLTEEDKACEYNFVNTYTEKQVTLTYIPVIPEGCPADKLGTVELTGDAASKTSANTGVNETIGMRLGVPVGSTATDNEIVEFVGWYSDATCETLISEDKAYLPEKAAGNDLWAEATYYAKFEFKYGDLTINKSGIESVDHHSKIGSHEEEKQSSVFQITGTSYSGQKIDMTVVIVGEDSVVIHDLPAGEYTVKEISNWTWRYEPTPKSQTVIVTANDASVDFVNHRETEKWLSGDNWIQNLLSMKSGS